jgi:hypothetical protein
MGWTGGVPAGPDHQAWSHGLAARVARAEAEQARERGDGDAEQLERVAVLAESNAWRLAEALAAREREQAAQTVTATATT